MDSTRIQEIQQKTAYPDSKSVQQALLQVWNECAQEQAQLIELYKREVATLTDLATHLREELLKLQK